ncbi:MAG TPA: glycosyl hydrolase, partial [Solirubrobacteraceae bacterium]|nr:glycosyl hydrolase [Solirubrobacteraceae bacterium]
YDSYIRASAQMAKAYGRRLYIRFAHEMNLPNSPFGPRVNGNTPARYVAAWRHVVRMFRQVGANKVEFVWSPNVYCDRACPFTSFYPGDRWVDWVALDGYNYGPADQDPWVSFRQIFGPSYGVMTRLTHRPLMIGETGCASAGGDKARWITGMGRDLRTGFPRVLALVWFQRVKEADFRVNSSRASLAAFRRVVRSFPFSP